MRTWNKVFEIGAPKTGTSSLGRAYEILGLRHRGYSPIISRKYAETGDHTEILEVAKNFDAFEDHPWHAPGLYKIFDMAFPNSKYILLIRDLESWMKSFEHHFSAEKNYNNIQHKYLIKDFEAKKDEIVKHFVSRYGEVREYFKDRPNDLLVMNICAGEGWEKLCPFLELPIPNKPFPYVYKTQNRNQRIIQKIRNISQRIFCQIKNNV
jgi:hypothetical protein